MIPSTAAQASRASPWVRLPAPHTREFVSREALHLIASTPLGKAALTAFRFQWPGLCEANSLRMQWMLTSILAAEGLASKHEFDPADERTSRWPVDTAQDLLRFNAGCGPLVLTLFKALPPDQGSEVYSRHHCVVLLASFKHRDRCLGLLLDGNDLQSNPAVERLRQWLREEGRGRQLQDLCSEELLQIGKDWAEQGNPETELHQTAFRLVDLDQLIRLSRAEEAKQPPAGWWDWLLDKTPRTQMRWAKCFKSHAPAISPETLDELKALIDQHPDLVEPALPASPEL